MSTVVLDQQNRNGSFDSGSVAVPAGTEFQLLLVSGTVSDADAQDSSKSCRINVLASWDGGANYVNVAAPYDWHGGLSPRDGSFTKPQQTLAVPADASGRRADRVMAVLDTLGVTLNTGLILDFA